ncbi:MAG: NAD(P)H-dependent oxidoreductase [Methanomassiliicoccaceae archaeon]|nr:NAD(P)H-dependent oxidoreductase [Methanomassiliicoccaceae archaeon]
MNAMIFNGSIRKNGRTAAMTSVIADAIRSKGSDAEEYFLYHMGVKGCLTCGYGAGRDNAVELVKKILLTDLVIFAGPIYLEHLPDPLNSLIDVLYYVCRGNDESLSKMEGKRIAVALITDGDARATEDPVKALNALSDHFKADFAGSLTIPFATIENVTSSGSAEKIRDFVSVIMKEQ